MQIENYYEKEVYNEDIGYVEGVNAEEGEPTASFAGRTVAYAFGELDALVSAYAPPRSTRARARSIRPSSRS